ncbi:MAG: 50S ribosome-binding GTPase [Lachnospiraceae bacterium]|nr:50S ribosome-binding GTPase [Lachnospiraceae bacterium]
MAEETKENKSVYDLLEEEIMALDIPDSEKAKRLSRLIKVRNKKVNIMLTGSTGAGKSSTINALFNMNVAKVGVGVDPETSIIEKFTLDNLVVWDTPGLGDGVKSDERISHSILEKLSELDEDGNPLIDLVVVVIDSSSKDLGTSYDLINNILIPALGDDAKDRILIALNQADVAMKGTHWDEENNTPDEVLKEFLKKKADSVQKRIKDATGLSIRPIYYCAGYKEEGGEQRKPYNLPKLLYYIIKSVPKDKRLALADNINDEEDNWLHDDQEKDYKERIKLSFGETVWFCISDGFDTGAEIGSAILGIPGKIVGATVGAAVGAVKGVFVAIFDI